MFDKTFELIYNFFYYTYLSLFVTSPSPFKTLNPPSPPIPSTFLSPLVAPIGTNPCMVIALHCVTLPKSLN